MVHATQEEEEEGGLGHCKFPHRVQVVNSFGAFQAEISAPFVTRIMKRTQFLLTYILAVYNCNRLTHFTVSKIPTQ